MFACSKLGAYFTLFNYAYTTSELLNAVQTTTPKVLFATRTTCRYNYTDALEQVQRSAGQLCRIVLLDDISGTKSDPERVGGVYVDYNTLIAQASRHQIDKVRTIQKSVQAGDVLNLQFTSGSTGLPKAAALTHFGMLNSARYIGHQMKLQPTDRINIPVPLFHAFGLVIGMYCRCSHELSMVWYGTLTAVTAGLCTAFVYGSAIVLPSEYFDVGDTLQAVEQYQCTGLYGVSTMFVDMLSSPHFESTVRSSLR
jgi:long-chain acyl-CoA synthetase